VPTSLHRPQSLSALSRVITVASRERRIAKLDAARRLDMRRPGADALMGRAAAPVVT